VTLTPLRKVPSRKRGTLRVERILQAAGDVFAEVGYAQATTNQIAARAETSIGSLYQFFADKDAIVRALAEQHKGRIRALLAQLYTPEQAGRSLREIGADHLALFLSYNLEHPGFKAILLDPQAAALSGSADFMTEVHHRLAQALRQVLPHPSDAQLAVYAQIVAGLVRGMVFTLTQATPAERPALLREAQAILGDYLDRIANA
jgi:AcrR family transcriptional regulator